MSTYQLRPGNFGVRVPEIIGDPVRRFPDDLQ